MVVGYQQRYFGPQALVQRVTGTANDKPAVRRVHGSCSYVPSCLFSGHKNTLTGVPRAVGTENDRLRQIRLHERINDLPDANYSTLKYILGHLHTIATQEAVNSMSIGNLAIVFGPTLFGAPLPTAIPNGNGVGGGASANSAAVADMNLQVKAVETILDHFTDIFVEEGA